MANRIEMFVDGSGKWRWRVKAGNNRTTAASEQGYRSYYYALLKAKMSSGFTTDVKIIEKNPPPTDPPSADPPSADPPVEDPPPEPEI